MTQEEFSKTGFYGAMPVIYEDEVRLVRSVDFKEALVGLVSKDDQGDIVEKLIIDASKKVK